MTKFFDGDPCKKCGTTKKYVNRKQCVACRAAYYAENKNERDQYQAEYQATPEMKQRRNDAARVRKIGVTPTMFNFTLAGQNFLCAKCLRDAPGGKGWAADHCHDTGRFRGVLCQSCNLGLGNLGDNVEGLIEAIEYIVGESLPTNLTTQILRMAGRANLSLLTAPNAKPQPDYSPAMSSRNTNERSRRSA